MELANIAFDCDTDPVELARWWQGLLGGELELEDGGACLLVPGFPSLDFWPGAEAKTVKNRLHLDLRAADFEADVAAAVAHGATKADDVYDGDRWQVLRDPAGNEFCVLRPRPSS